jgi:2-polyprenyl-3-methyl-5-hydroxy-6-metoxy-1,4-benzoquinol methylase
MRNPISRIPAVIKGTLVERVEPCRVCNAQQGEQFAVVDYWNIKTSRLVKCPECNHIQLDPMLNDAETAEGCYAYYLEEALRTSHEEQVKNCVRNFRRGVHFGDSLKKRKINPKSVLELGPGSGYFSAGIQFVFPATEISVMDVNREVLRFNREHHGYEIMEGIPDNYLPEYAGKFDLVIARDILEHVTDISKVVWNVNRYLLPGGYFHFITPNGHEDVWKHYLAAQLTNALRTPDQPR